MDLSKAILFRQITATLLGHRHRPCEYQSRFPSSFQKSRRAVAVHFEATLRSLGAEECPD